MAIRRFEDIIAWQRAQSFAVEIYNTFRGLKDFGFRNQICSASISISSNIAEGFERKSHADFSRFLHIAAGSCSEAKSLLYIAGELSYLKKEDKERLVRQANEIGKIIHGLIRSLRTNP